MLACELLASLLASCCNIILQLSRTSRHDPKMKIGSELTRGDSAEKATKKKKQKGKKATVSKNNTVSQYLPSVDLFRRASNEKRKSEMRSINFFFQFNHKKYLVDTTSPLTTNRSIIVFS